MRGRRPKVLIARPRSAYPTPVVSNQFVIEEVSQMSSLIAALSSRPPAVLLLSLDLPGLAGAASVRDLRQLSPTTKIIVLVNTVDEQEELDLLRMGVKGYCGPVNDEVLIKMIDKVQEGEVWAGRKTIGALLDEFYGGVSYQPERGLVQSQIDRLTHREREILRQLANGASNKEIASALGVAVSTVKAHMTKIFRKLGQPDRLHLARSARHQRRAAVGEAPRTEPLL